MIKSELYPNLKLGEYWSITKIYNLSKKYDDLEGDMYLHTLYLVLYAEKKNIRLKSREQKLKLCRVLWKYIKVCLVLSENLDRTFIYILNCIRDILSKGVTIINKEFRETQDSEVVNFPDPDKQEYINQVRSLFSIKHKTELTR